YRRVSDRDDPRRLQGTQGRALCGLRALATFHRALLAPFRSPECRADRTGARAERGRDDLHALDRRDAYARAQLAAERLQQQLARRDDAAADDDALRREDQHGVRERDAEVARCALERVARTTITRARVRDHVLDARA